MTEKHTIKTKKSEIVDYWQNSPDYGVGCEDSEWLGLEQEDLAKDGGRCWRCATTKNVQRCHIVAHSHGGSDCPSNYALLCRTCHDDAPMVSNASSIDIFAWIGNSRKALFEYLRATTQFGFMDNLAFKSYAEVGDRGAFWNFKVFQLAMQNHGVDLAREENNLIFDMFTFFKSTSPNPSRFDLKATKKSVNFIMDCYRMLRDIMVIIDYETQIGIHMRQESGRVAESSFSSEALARVKTIQHMKSFVESSDDRLGECMGKFLPPQEIERYNKLLEYDFFKKA